MYHDYDISKVNILWDKIESNDQSAMSTLQRELLDIGDSCIQNILSSKIKSSHTSKSYKKYFFCNYLHKKSSKDKKDTSLVSDK